MPRSDLEVAAASESLSAVRSSRTTNPVQRFHTNMATAAIASGTAVTTTARLVTGRSVGATTNATTAMSINAAGRISRQTASGITTRTNDGPRSWNRPTASTSASAINATSTPLVPTTPNRNHAEGV